MKVQVRTVYQLYLKLEQIDLLSFRYIQVVLFAWA